MNHPVLWSETSSVTRRVVEDLSEEFADEIGEMSGSCIDIGSGPGEATIDFVFPKMNNKATIVCSDISENMVNYGREKYRGNTRISFIQLDIECPNLPADFVGRFDHVTSVYCFQWCKDMRQVFKNVFDLLRPGGTSFITFVAKTAAVDAYNILATIPRYKPYMEDSDGYTPVFQHAKKPRATLKALLKDVGFQVRHCSHREKTWVFNNPEDFLNLMLAVNPFIDRMPNDLKDEFKKDLCRETAKQNVVFNINRENADDYSVLFIHEVFVVCLKKPPA